MEELRGANSVTQEFVPMRSNSFSADLLQRLIPKNLRSSEKSLGEDDDGIELSLGLSLNGRFGTDPRTKNDAENRSASLKRSSSISDFTLTSPAAAAREGGHVPLGRSCSLPTDTVEDWRRRKELQSLRRLEAKRKRSEKQRNSSSAKLPRVEPLVSSTNGGDHRDVALPPQLSFQGSVGSHGSGSSGVSESDSLASQGGGQKWSETRSPTSVHSLPESEQKVVVARGTIARLRSGDFNGSATEANKRPALAKSGSREIARSVLEDMPCVSTTGVGPNGKRIEGFLYRYRKDEEVRIVCVCHGSFLSPAEFVKHAGGGDVAHPLKHIVVSPSSFL